METSSSSSAAASDSILQALILKGWCFRNNDQIKQLIATHLSSSSKHVQDSVESELLNSDLRSIGGKCLPNPSLLSKTPHLQGPIILQVSSSRDISRSSISESSAGKGRLLRLKLTDGHSEITAVEYSHIPSIPHVIIPGTKVRLQNKVDIFSGIVCLNSKVITVLGGTVQPLHEEWEMKRKYMNISKQSKENASGCPPFEKFQVGARARVTSDTSATRGARSSDTADVSRPSIAEKGESSNSSQIAKLPSNNGAKGSPNDDVKQLKDASDDNEKQAQKIVRPKVAASVPVQNQEAAQKLLQKTNEPNYNDRNSRRGRGRGRGRGREREEDSNFLTLDEWERRKHGGENPATHAHSSISQDEDLARQMQEQFDLEDQGQMDSHGTGAKDITMSMFNFERNDPDAFGRGDFRGRGRGGRGRRSRGRGRGRF